MAQRRNIVAGVVYLLCFTALFIEFQSQPWLERSSRFRQRKRTQVAAGIELRILPLGDSITYGYQTTDDGNQNNGYRLQLQKDLSGSNVTFVGSVRSGSMTDNHNEGHNGATIKQIEGFANLSLNQRPNVILVHAGSNDLNDDPPKDPYTNAPDRLSSLLSKIKSSCPDATILVAQIIQIKGSASNARVTAYNARIPGLVASQVAQGHRNIAAVDFSSITANDLEDGLHPTNNGYTKMGDIWFAAIQSAASKGWIKAPNKADPSAVAATGGTQQCADGLFWYPAQKGAPVASGIGHGGDGLSTTGDGVDDYIYVDEVGILTAYVNGGPSGTASAGWIWYLQGEKGVINTGVGAKREQIILADIDATGDKKADYLVVNMETGAVTAYLNGGRNPKANKGWVWLPQGVVATGIGRDGQGVRFADINGDGKADYVWLSQKGEMEVYLNVIGENPAKFVPYNNGKFVATGVGGKRDEIRLADINGDRRADYIRIHQNNGSVDLWTNQVGINPANWIQHGSVASGVGSSGPNVRFGILTTSGRADYIPVVPSSGAITPWLNGCKKPATTLGNGAQVHDKGSGANQGKIGGLDDDKKSGSGRAGGDGEDDTLTGGVVDADSGTRPGPGSGSGPLLGDVGKSEGEDGFRGANSSQSGPKNVLLPPSIWTDQDPVIQCEPPCVFVLPPYQLPSATTITFPPYTTTLGVAWLTTAVTTAPGGAVSTVSTYTRTLQKTVLTIPPLTTTAIEVWNVRITGSDRPSSLSLDITSSVAPPPFQITDDPNPENKPGVKHPPVVRMITPPPFPYIQTLRDPRFPVVKFKPGPPPPVPCISNCGRPCILFCKKPCLIGCGPGTDFPGPNDPDPPPNPNDPNPPPGPDQDPDKDEKKSSSKCSTKTASSCGVECNVSPSTCSTKCVTTTGCSVTDTTNSNTITPAPFALWTGETWSTNNDPGRISAQIAAANSILDAEFPGWRSNAMEPSHMSEPTPTPTPPPAPRPPPPRPPPQLGAPPQPSPIPPSKDDDSPSPPPADNAPTPPPPDNKDPPPPPSDDDKKPPPSPKIDVDKNKPPPPPPSDGDKPPDSPKEEDKPPPEKCKLR
ncbi:MAG: hypothetical protein Q9168_003480 [Polycauliona sp. 1 TL-2023]